MGYVCIHSHFYQPPRENPWLEAIELQDSARPYHDWNERIMAECYAPNATSRILDSQGRIVKIVSNYAKISFDFGPTLLSWLEIQAPEVYRVILEADRGSRKACTGHGSAIAQAYNHMILPLANRRDKHTQVVWGISDFRHRFKRKPEGMWLPETAVDIESLEILAELGVRFTILGPHQARRVRKIGGKVWRELRCGEIDPSMAYRLRLPSRRSINLFFYDGPISRAVAFENLLSNGEHFAQRLIDGFAEAVRPWPELVHIATDGETYGHHHRNGDMGLAYALHHIETNQLAQITNYGEYLEKHPPTHEVEIWENTSWSCAHGVGRWERNCGCHSGAHPEWSQTWRAPLREAFDWLRDILARPYEDMAGKFLKDPWAARNNYIQIILNRSPQSLDNFLKQEAVPEFEASDRVTLLKLMELQRHAQLMYTSCGWFFDELSGIETVQIMQYAGRAIHLAHELFGNSLADELESQFLDMLARAKSNIPEHRDGLLIYEKFVKPAIVDLPKVGAHYAISSLFEPHEKHARIYCYSVECQDYKCLESGKARLAVGRARFTSEVTQESCPLDFGVLHFGDHNLSGGVRYFRESDSYQNLVQEATDAFSSGDLPQVIRILDRGFGTDIYSLRLLFRDQQRLILNMILESKVTDATARYGQIYDGLAPLMQYLRSAKMPLPKSFQMAAEFALNHRLREAFAREKLDPDRIGKLLDEAGQSNVVLDLETLEFTLRKNVERFAVELLADPRNPSLLQRLEIAVGLTRSLPFEINMRTVENVCYRMLETVYPNMKRRADRGDEKATEWIALFDSQAEKLRVRISFEANVSTAKA